MINNHLGCAIDADFDLGCVQDEVAGASGETYDSSFTGDGILQALDSDQSTTADGILQNLDLGFDVTCDGILQSQNNDQDITSDGILQSSSDQDITSDGILQDQNLDLEITSDGVLRSTSDKDITIDGLLIFSGADHDATADGILQSQDNDQDATADGTLQKTFDTGFTSDGALLARDIDSSVVADGILQSQNNDQDVVADGVLQTTDNDQDATADGALQAVFDQDVIADGILRAQDNDQDVVADGVLQTTDNDSDITSDGVLRSTSDQDVTADGIIRSLNGASATADGVLQSTSDEDIISDGYLVFTIDQDITADGICKANDNDQDVVADGALQTPNQDQGISVDGLLVQQTTFDLEITADSILFGTFDLDITSDARIRTSCNVDGASEITGWNALTGDYSGIYWTETSIIANALWVDYPSGSSLEYSTGNGGLPNTGQWCSYSSMPADITGIFYSTGNVLIAYPDSTGHTFEYPSTEYGLVLEPYFERHQRCTISRCAIAGVLASGTTGFQLHNVTIMDCPTYIQVQDIEYHDGYTGEFFNCLGVDIASGAYADGVLRSIVSVKDFLASDNAPFISINNSYWSSYGTYFSVNDNTYTWTAWNQLGFDTSGYYGISGAPVDLYGVPLSGSVLVDGGRHVVPNVIYTGSYPDIGSVELYDPSSPFTGIYTQTGSVVYGLDIQVSTVPTGDTSQDITTQFDQHIDYSDIAKPIAKTDFGHLDLRDHLGEMIGWEQGFHWLILRVADITKKCDCLNENNNRPAKDCKQCFGAGYKYTDYLVKGVQHAQVSELSFEEGYEPPGIVSSEVFEYTISHNYKPRHLDLLIEIDHNLETGDILYPIKITRVFRIIESRILLGDRGRLEFYTLLVELLQEGRM